jgi:hypothetical protein
MRTSCNIHGHDITIARDGFCQCPALLTGSVSASPPPSLADRVEAEAHALFEQADHPDKSLVALAASWKAQMDARMAPHPNPAHTGDTKMITHLIENGWRGLACSSEVHCEEVSGESVYPLYSVTYEETDDMNQPDSYSLEKTGYFTIQDYGDNSGHHSVFGQPNTVILRWWRPKAL